MQGYGNASFRIWHARLEMQSESLMNRFLPDDLRSSTVKIVPYFSDSFGNYSRIDYVGFNESWFIVSRIFVKYLDLMRLVYRLEPTGFHGVWELDDYHFLPFIFGSLQLINHRYIKLKSIHNDDTLENFSKVGLPNWNKVNSGMLKMYKAEVLEKVPIMLNLFYFEIE
ncbi:hypothetical protein UlMin_028149 [Ulmus minor]